MKRTFMSTFIFTREERCSDKEIKKYNGMQNKTKFNKRIFFRISQKSARFRQKPLG